VNVVNPGSPAANAGLRSNDVITEVAGRRVESSAGLQRIVQSRAPKDIVDIGFIRAGRKQAAKVQLEENAAMNASHLLGMQLIPLTQSEAGEIGMPGLKVVAIDRRSPASGYMQAGDVITHVVLGQQARPASTSLLKQLEQRLARGGGGQIVIVRDGYQLVLTLR
jgi:S1-C subfamily serine protease